ncbi:MAG TPA: PepSY domain-containing protein [Gemmatimonadaceae bacterium]|nr:PepSY domain-containing protein [Gemmatimonadaceae bacterium]
MRTTRFATLAFLAVAVTAVTTTAGAQPPAHRHTTAVKKVETQAELQKEAHMTMADARAMALETVPTATIQAGEIEREGGKLIYSFDMKVPGKSGIDEVNIDAMTGKLVSHQHETPKDERAEAKADAKADAKAAKAAKSKP